MHIILLIFAFENLKIRMSQLTGQGLLDIWLKVSCELLNTKNKKFLPIAKDQYALIKARLGITPTTYYKATHGHLIDSDKWENQCAACLHSVKDDLHHTLCSCPSTSKIRSNANLKPNINKIVDTDRAHLTLLSDYYLENPHKHHHFAPVHMIANILHTHTKKTAMRLRNEVHDQSHYARYKKKKLLKKINPQVLAGKSHGWA